MAENNTENEFTNMTLWMASVCKNCKLCGYARKKQKGSIYWIVKNIEANTCPFCRAYYKVNGLKSYEPVPNSDNG